MMFLKKINLFDKINHANSFNDFNSIYLVNHLWSLYIFFSFLPIQILFVQTLLDGNESQWFIYNFMCC